MAFADIYREAFTTIARPLTDADAMAEELIAEHEQRLGVRLPEALRTYYAIAGNMGQLNEAHDYLLSPSAWRVDRRVMWFWSENQGVTKWGVSATRRRRNDPAVLYTTYHGDGEYADWVHEDLVCSDFLVLMLCWQAVHGGLPHTGWAEVRPQVSEAVAQRWGQALQSRDLRTYYRPGQVLCIAGSPQRLRPDRPWLDLFVAGRSRAEFAPLVQEIASFGVDLEVQSA